MHPGRPFYWTLLLQPKIDLDWVSGLYSLGSCLDIFFHVGGPNALVNGLLLLGSAWAKFALCYFFVFSTLFGPHMCHFHLCPVKQVEHQNLWNKLVLSPIH
jgi:hypothetical protein